MLKLINIYKLYRKKAILKNVNLQLPDKGVFLIKGKNGSGKTTLFNIIAKTTSYKGKVINKKSMSYLFQHPQLLEYLTIKEHFELFKINTDILEKVNLIGKLEEYPKTLSSGERQRIGLLLSIYSDVGLVLLDEPFSNIDKENIKVFSDYIEKQGKQKLILIISHDYNDMINYDGCWKR